MPEDLALPTCRPCPRCCAPEMPAVCAFYQAVCQMLGGHTSPGSQGASEGPGTFRDTVRSKNLEAIGSQRICSPVLFSWHICK